MASNFWSMEEPLTNGSNCTIADATKHLPCPSCTLWNRSVRWKDGLFESSWRRSFVKHASVTHGIVAGGILWRNAGESDLGMKHYTGSRLKEQVSYKHESYMVLKASNTSSYGRLGDPAKQRWHMGFDGFLDVGNFGAFL